MKVFRLAAVMGLTVVLAGFVSRRCSSRFRAAGELEKSPAFEPFNVTGEAAGQKNCLGCQNGGNPVVMIFAREESRRS